MEKKSNRKKGLRCLEVGPNYKEGTQGRLHGERGEEGGLQHEGRALWQRNCQPRPLAGTGQGPAVVSAHWEARG